MAFALSAARNSNLEGRQNTISTRDQKESAQPAVF
jgi:hypothetical protein